MNKILIIEDDPAIQLGVEEYLSSQSFTVLKSADGKEGLKLALNELPDLILLDINLPSINGLEICRILREKDFRKPIIMLTSMTEKLDKVVGLEVGASDYVTKPFDLRELLARIRAQLRYTEKIVGVSEMKSSQGTKDTLQRYLLALMFSDMEDYSKKMNKDEKLALELLQIHNKLISETIERYDGKIIEIIGDAFLASFESAINSLKCCIAIQEKFNRYNIGKSKFKKIRIRIGAHIGDVIKFEGKLKGDALNITARIQQLAKPGSIYISENFYLTIKGKLEKEFKNVGTFNLKNIKESINVYEVIT